MTKTIMTTPPSPSNPAADQGEDEFSSSSRALQHQEQESSPKSSSSLVLDTTNTKRTPVKKSGDDDDTAQQQHSKNCIKAQRRYHYAVAAVTVAFLLSLTFIVLLPILWRYYGNFDIPIINHENTTTITPTMITSRTTTRSNPSPTSVTSGTLSSMQRESMSQAKIIKCSSISLVNEVKDVYLGTTSKEEVTLVQPDCPAKYNLLLSSKSRGVWYRILLGQGSSCVTLSTCHDDTNFDTRIRVFQIDNAAATISRSSTINESTQLENITCVVANDDFLGMGGFEQESSSSSPEVIMPSSVKKGIHHQCPEFTHSSAVTFHMQDNIWYYVFIDGFDEPDHGNFGLSVICDSCSSSATLTPTNAPTTLSPTNAPTFSPATYDEFELLISMLTKASSNESLRDSLSPQGQALAWILDEFNQWRPLFITDKNNVESNNSFTQMTMRNATNSTIISPNHLIERYILVVLYYSTNGKNWTYSGDFLNHTKSVCEWAGYRINCHDDKQLQRIDLGNNYLNGSIPAELGLLSQLESLSLGDNAITGTLPSELGQLSKLTSMSLRDNFHLHGTIPSSFGNLSNETFGHLTLHDLNLTGTIPSELGQLRGLRSLYLRKNMLTGTVPTEFGQLSNLATLTLNLNNLEGDAEFLCNLPWAGSSFWVDKEKVQCSCCRFF